MVLTLKSLNIKMSFQYSFDVSSLDELEERSMIEPGMINNHDYQELLKILVNWINDELRFESGFWLIFNHILFIQSFQ